MKHVPAVLIIEYGRKENNLIHVPRHFQAYAGRVKCLVSSQFLGQSTFKIEMAQRLYSQRTLGHPFLEAELTPGAPIRPRNKLRPEIEI